MNKFGMVIGVAAVATLAGCKDPDFNRSKENRAQDEVKIAVADEKSTPTKAETIEVTTTAEPKEVTPTQTPSTTPAIEPEYTTYIVQNGDYLAKISKKYNVTISSIKRLNPQIKKDVIRVGQKLKLPGKIDVGVQEAPKTWAATATTASKAAATGAAASKKSVTTYTGPTKEYVVKNGDTLGAIAYGNGINIRQLKNLNNLTSDSLKIGQKLKVPAEKVVAAKSAEKSATKADVGAVAKKGAEAPTVSAASDNAAVTEAAAEGENADLPEAAVVAPTEEKAEEAAPAQAQPATTGNKKYVVREGDDVTGVAISWGVPAATIRELNNMSETDQLVPGSIINLPPEAQQ